MTIRCCKLIERYNLPIAVDNDVNFAALGELWFGGAQNVANMVFITIGTGIGAGIIIDGALYRGAHEASGEIGNMLPDRAFLGKRYQEFGALETIASGTGIAERARQALKGRESRRNWSDYWPRMFSTRRGKARPGPKR
jgi:glucokinase